MAEAQEKTGSGQKEQKQRAQTRRNVISPPQDVLLASVTLAMTLSQGRSQYEIETLINLFSLTTSNLQTILTQMLINRKSDSEINIIL